MSTIYMAYYEEQAATLHAYGQLVPFQIHIFPNRISQFKYRSIPMPDVKLDQTRTKAAQTLEEAIALSSQGAFDKAVATLQRGIETLG